MSLSILFFLFTISGVLSLPQDEGCVPIKNCPSALKHIPRVKNHNESRKILLDAHCGYMGFEPIVKCGDISDPPEDVGGCIRLQDCPEALRLIEIKVFDPQVVNMFRSAHCGMEQLHPLVYCNQINFK